MAKVDMTKYKRLRPNEKGEIEARDPVTKKVVGWHSIRKNKDGKDVKMFVPVKEENIQELSKTTLGSYIKKAAKRSGRAAYAAGSSSARNHSTSSEDMMKIVAKREKGINMAANKLSEEKEMSKSRTIVDSIVTGKVGNIRENINNQLALRALDAVEARKIAVAKTMFGENNLSEGFVNVGKTKKGVEWAGDGHPTPDEGWDMKASYKKSRSGELVKVKSPVKSK